ncbi:MAG: hypothetical protein EXS13_10220 [Planctomycetes bacterium]|nr:hypothetical protein [Planctomycetota bacterium]
MAMRIKAAAVAPSADRWLGCAPALIAGACTVTCSSGRVAPVQETSNPVASSLAQVDTADDLSKRATDPTASLMSLGLIGTYSGPYRGDAPGLDDHTTRLKFQPVIPFKAWGTDNILRVTMPYTLDGRGAEGLGDVSIFDLVVIHEDWGRWGIGPVMTFASDVNAPDQFVAGPAIGGVYQVDKELNVGLFNQNVFGGDTAISRLQPIFAYQLGDGWALSAGDLQYVYDWEDGRWISAPIGFQIGKVTRIAGQPMRFAFNPQYEMLHDDGLPEWTLSFSVTLLAPTH